LLDADGMAALDVDAVQVARTLAALAISVVQIRCKGDGGRQYDFACRWMDVLRRWAPGVAVILNDRADVALAVQADGVHVGQTDLPVTAVRDVVGPERWIGLSTHTLEEAVAAQESGADYIGFGPVFATASKADALAPRGLSLLKSVCLRSRLPVVAIGGIGLDGLGSVYAAGAAGAAMIGALWQPDWSGQLRHAVVRWDDGGDEKSVTTSSAQK
jgi:thiamine-phosphate pyrophosphorylase